VPVLVTGVAIGVGVEVGVAGEHRWETRWVLLSDEDAYLPKHGTEYSAS